MSRPVLQVRHPGILTTVQDRGRYGYQRYGVPVSGAMDQLALRAANLLVGNDQGAACLEMTVIGPTGAAALGRDGGGDGRRPGGRRGRGAVAEVGGCRGRGGLRAVVP